jgi:superkiller protein 3
MGMRDRLRTTGGWIAALLLAVTVGCGGGKQEPQAAHELTTSEKVRRSQSMMRAGRVNDALEIIDDVIADEPDNAILYNVKGQFLFLAGRYDEALTVFHKAVELDPYLTDAHNFLGATYDELGQKAEAEREYRIALADPAYPTPELVWLNLGLLYVSEGREAEAVEAFRKSVEINPKYYKAHYELALTLERLGQLEEAIREFEVAEPGFDNVGEFYYRMGLTFFRMGDKERARETLNQVIALAPGSPSAAQADDLLRMID